MIKGEYYNIRFSEAEWIVLEYGGNIGRREIEEAHPTAVLNRHGEWCYFKGTDDWDWCEEVSSGDVILDECVSNKPPLFSLTKTKELIELAKEYDGSHLGLPPFSYEVVDSRNGQVVYKDHV